MLVANAMMSAIVNLILLAVVPFAVYALYHRVRMKRSLAEILRRAGLQGSSARFVGYAALLAAVTVIGLIVWPPPLEPMPRQGSAQRDFVGLGLNATSVFLALLYGIVKTGFSGEFLVRGLIAGSLSRRLPFWWANLVQALIFLAPHLVLLRIMPEAWPVLILVCLVALFLGWLRIRSGSIVGPGSSTPWGMSSRA